MSKEFFFFVGLNNNNNNNNVKFHFSHVCNRVPLDVYQYMSRHISKSAPPNNIRVFFMTTCLKSNIC